MAGVVVDERGKSTSTSTMLEVDEACQEQDRFWDCCFGGLWLLLYIYSLVVVFCHNQIGA